MSSLKDSEKRGRPDIVGFCLLEALGTPLNRAGLLRVYVHTINDYVIIVSPEVRLPRNYNRFVGLVEKLYRAGKISADGHILLELRRETLQSLLERLHPSRVFAFSVLGKPTTVDKAVSSMVGLESPVALVGGFPKGHFSENTAKLADEVLAIDPEGLDAWVVVSRILYEFERLSGLPEKRWSMASKVPPKSGSYGGGNCL
jgi:rRNA small subunit pseudouridine methyltransferase Nep1